MPNTRKNLRELIDQYYIQNFAPTNRKLTDHLIANGVTVQKWIPVTERLPTPYERVLVCRGDLRSENKFICVEYLTVCYGETIMWGGDYETWKSKVTHWMPLPEPPKGE